MNDGEVVLTEDHDKNFRAVDFCPEEAQCGKGAKWARLVRRAGIKAD